ncbi:protein of unknown function [Pararobbsia alpina]
MQRESARLRDRLTRRIRRTASSRIHRLAAKSVFGEDVARRAVQHARTVQAVHRASAQYRSMSNAILDHLAFPSFNAAATHRFYTEVMGLRLVRASSGVSAQWHRPYLLFSYELGNGTTLGFFEFEGIERPESDDLPRDIRHVGLSVPSAADFDQWLAKLDRCGVEYAIERHVDGRHAFFCDPNGVMFEITVAAAEATASKRAPTPQKVIEQWIDERKQRQGA